MGETPGNMFILKRLKLHGFKSFASETRIDLARGVTAIVGPNGSGKSNISDALLWVMGEQSVKSLRGDSMEDVIFNGSDKLAPMGMAHVELKIENMNPGEGEDRIITIERKFFRTGEGEYRLNGKRVRRKDINEFLLEIGLGSKSYSIIEQGKIGIILSSRPEDRRYLIEEAAGILKYKMKRKEAENKIKLTNENLERIEDIISEVKRNLNSLRQQAGRAKQFKRIQEELNEYKLELYSHKGFILTKAIDGMKKKKAEMENATAAAMAECAEKEHQIESGKTAILNSENEISMLSRDFFDRKIKSERLESELVHSQHKINEIEIRLNDTDVSLKDQKKEEDSLEFLFHKESENLKLAENDIDTIEERKEEAETAVGELKTLLQQREEEFMLSDRTLKKLETAQFELSGRLQTVKNTIRMLSEDIAARQSQLNSQEEDIAAIESRIEKKQKDKVDVEHRANAADELLESLYEQKTNITSMLEEKKDEHSRLKIEKKTLENNITDKENFLEKREGFSEHVKNLIHEKPHLIKGVIGDFIESSGKYDAALEPFASSFYQVIVPHSEEALKELVEYAQFKNMNGVSFLVMGNTSATNQEGLLEHIQFKEKLSKEFTEFLSSVSVCEDYEKGIKKKTSFITYDGNFYLKHKGILSVGRKDDHGFLSIKTFIKKSKKELKSIDKKESVLRDSIEALSFQMEDINEAIEEARNRKDSLKIEMTSLMSSLSNEKENLSGKLREKDRFRLEIDEKNTKLEENKHSEEYFRSEIEKQGETISLLMTQRDHKEQVLTETRHALEDKTEELSEYRLLHEKRISTVNSIKKELSFIERRKKELKENTEKTQKQKLIDKENLSILKQSIVEIKEKADVIIREYREIDGILQQKKQDLAEKRKGLSVQETQLSSMKRKEQSRKDEEQKVLVEIAEKQANLNNLMENLERIDKPESFEFCECLEIQEVEEKAAALDRRVENFGIVNLLAIQECEEQEHRHEFLSTQREDLINALNNLNRDIREIDETTKDLFRQAFDFINEKFTEVFVKLFKGGKAKLSLSDPDNLLETGLDIFAQPPGKKIQNITLMSGGEKALTALALLFAIFEYRISPLCVLDEVDAPLDEVNVVQFGHFLKQYRENVQFLIITHNKTTMEMVDSLYGVTMEEPGCSKLISVQLEEV